MTGTGLDTDSGADPTMTASLDSMANQNDAERDVQKRCWVRWKGLVDPLLHYIRYFIHVSTTCVLYME